MTTSECKTEQRWVIPDSAEYHVLLQRGWVVIASDGVRVWMIKQIQDR